MPTSCKVEGETSMSSNTKFAEMIYPENMNTGDLHLNRILFVRM